MSLVTFIIICYITYYLLYYYLCFQNYFVSIYETTVGVDTCHDSGQGFSHHKPSARIYSIIPTHEQLFTVVSRLSSVRHA